MQEQRSDLIFLIHALWHTCIKPAMTDISGAVEQSRTKRQQYPYLCNAWWKRCHIYCWVDKSQANVLIKEPKVSEGKNACHENVWIIVTIMSWWRISFDIHHVERPPTAKIAHKLKKKGLRGISKLTSADIRIEAIFLRIYVLCFK